MFCRHIAQVALLTTVLLTISANARSEAPVSTGLGNEYCPVAPGYLSVRLRTKLPRVLQRKFRGIAMPDEPWNSTDVIEEGLPFTGFHFLWNKGSRWIVMVGRGGGIAVPPPSIEIYDVSPDGGAIMASRRPGDLGVSCEAAISYAKP